MVKPSTGEHTSNPGKEEGELTPSDDDEQPICSIATPTGSFAPPTGGVSAPSTYNSTQRSQTGNTASSNRSADNRTVTLMRPSSQKIENKPVPFSSTNPPKNGPVGANRNLVISFSDDDSGSDSDMNGQGLASEVQPNVATVSGKGKPPMSSLTKLNRPRQIDRSINNAIPKNSSFSRTFNRASNSRAVNISSVDQQLPYRDSRALKKNPGKQEHRSDKIVGLNDHKLQDLRQQIQRRESELKLKAVRPNKDTVNQNIDAARKSNEVSADFAYLEPNEPNKKRMKVSGSFSAQPVLDGRLQIPAPLVSEEPLGKGGLQDGTKVNNGAEIRSSYNQIDRNIDQVNPNPMSHQNIEGRTSSSTLQNHTLSGNNSSLWNYMGNASVSGHHRIDIQALVNLEESFDKELEEAQEYRRHCEIEERNALKAYRKAQRSLIEANARCAELYRRREMCSANFRSLITEDPSLFWPSRHHEHAGTGFDTSNNITENMDIIPKANLVDLNHGGLVQRKYDQIIDGFNTRPHHVPYPLGGQNLGSEPCNEPVGSTSDRLPCSRLDDVNRLRSPSCDMIISPEDDDETFPIDHEPSQHDFEHKQKEEHCEGTQRGIEYDLNRNVPADGVQDSLLLEATLRSALFARLGIRTSVKDGGSCYNTEAVIDRGAESDFASEKTQMSDGSLPFSEMDKNQQNDFGGSSRLERNVSEGPAQSEEQFPTMENLSNVPSNADLEPNDFSPGGDFSSTSVAFSAPLFLRSTFVHLKVMTLPIIPVESENIFLHKSYIMYNNEMRSDLIGTSIREKDIGSYSCDFKVDPFWPLCMYELRGRCNNHECPWQHFKNSSNENMHKDQRDNFDGTDDQLGLTLHRKKSNVEARSKFLNFLASPAYLLCLDTMKVGSHAYESVIARRHGQSWWKYFSASVASSSLLQKDVLADEPLRHRIEGHNEFLGTWRTPSSYFGSKNSMTNQLKQGSDASIHSLEKALLILNREVNKPEGIAKALGVLSRSLEADPTSEILWVVYLLLFYCSAKSTGDDTMFSYAVKHNQGSYGLWIMYINSQRQLSDQLVAYDAAFRALCGHALTSEIDRTYASACVLDLFLQMINCWCMSGNVAKAIQRICRLLPAAETSDDPLIACLTFSDKCVFWICCVFLVIYRKLPDAVIQGLELEKELLSIEWPLVDLIGDVKERALKLLETGVQSVELQTADGSLGSGINLQSAHRFALNHVQCMAALNDLECCRSLLENYIKRYPSCIELQLIAARMQQSDLEDMGFSAFEEVLSNWPKEAPGAQCIWNQYAEYVLQNGRYEFSKKLMARWYSSVWSVCSPQSETGSVMISDTCGLAELASSNPDVAASQLDLMFGFLNLSLHSSLQGDHNEARLAIDRALKAAAPEHFMHCMREHAVFMLNRESQEKGSFPVRLQLSLLNSYLNHARSFPVKEPLSWKFINNIEKPRVRQLVSNLLTPISSEFSLVNMVLEAWYGPSLLPQKLDKQKDLVDYVEAILDLVPSNYPLALSVCKQLRSKHRHTDVGSASILFWASSNLLNTISCAVPIPPDYIWVEAGDTLSSIAGTEAIAERIYEKAVSVYPFSVKLWKSYYNLSKTIGTRKSIMEAAREKGVEL